MNRNDKILIAVLLLLSVCSLFLQRVIEKPGENVLVTVDGKEYGTYSLEKEQQIKINQSKDKKNVLVIKDHSAYIKQASCKDLVCVHQRKIKKTGEAIICLPNKVVIEIIGGEEDVDIITG